MNKQINLLFFFQKSACCIQRRTWVWIFSIYVRSWAQWCTSVNSVLGIRKRGMSWLAWMVHLVESRRSRFTGRYYLQNIRYKQLKNTHNLDLWSLWVYRHTTKEIFSCLLVCKRSLIQVEKLYLVINVLLRRLM